MKIFLVSLLLILISPITYADWNDGYEITGRSGVMYFVAIAEAQKNNEDVYRSAVGEACAGAAICQVQFWINRAPRSFPLTDSDVRLKVVHWRQNLNTGLRRWLVNCSTADAYLFRKHRECM